MCKLIAEVSMIPCAVNKTESDGRYGIRSKVVLLHKSRVYE